jgi:hypothetical protein
MHKLLMLSDPSLCILYLILYKQKQSDILVMYLKGLSHEMNKFFEGLQINYMRRSF